MAKTNAPLTLEASEYAIKMTPETFGKVFGGEPRDIGFPGFSEAWHASVTMPAIKRHWLHDGYSNKVVAVAFYGYRSLYRLKEEGYHLAGKCKVRGWEVSGYTSSLMVEVEGNLYEVAVISIRGEYNG